MKPTSLACLVTAVIALCPAALQAAPGSSPASPAGSSASVSSAQQNLQSVQQQVKAGVLPAIAEQDAQITLAQARIQVGLAQNDTAGVTASLQQIITGREKQLDLAQTQYRAGAVDQNAVLDVRTALARARIRADIYPLVCLDQQKLDDVQRLFKIGAASQSESDQAAGELKKAQELFNSTQPICPLAPNNGGMEGAGG